MKDYILNNIYNLASFTSIVNIFDRKFVQKNSCFQKCLLTEAFNIDFDCYYRVLEKFERGIFILRSAEISDLDEYAG